MKDKAYEYAQGMMGEDFEYFTHHADKQLFKNLERAYKAGQKDHIDFIGFWNSFKASLVENCLRHDYRLILEQIDIIDNTLRFNQPNNTI